MSGTYRSCIHVDHTDIQIINTYIQVIQIIHAYRYDKHTGHTFIQIIKIIPTYVYIHVCIYLEASLGHTQLLSW